MRARLLRAAAVVALTLVVCEIGYRVALATPLALFDPLRSPSLYADQFSEDAHWLLYDRFGGRLRPPAMPHPVLGWVGAFDRETIRHGRADAVGRRRPLLYGDSFAEGARGRSTIPELVNGDPDFVRRHYLVNYAAGGYGLDQIYLVLEPSLHHHQRPFAIVSLMTRDLDRSVLSFRIGQKPRLRLVDGVLLGSIEPIDPDPTRWIAAHPPAIGSYLYRRVLYGGLLPARLADWLRDDAGGPRGGPDPQRPHRPVRRPPRPALRRAGVGGDRRDRRPARGAGRRAAARRFRHTSVDSWQPVTPCPIVPGCRPG